MSKCQALIDARDHANANGWTMLVVPSDELSALLADLDAAVGALEMVSNHYSASLDWQPPYVRASRAALSQIKAAGREQA